jgi:methyl-accepting chemotaxis protein
VKLSVRTKLLGGFLVVIGLMVAVGVVSISRIDQVNDNVERFGDEIVPGLADVGAMNAFVFRYRADQLDYLVSDAAGRRAASASMNRTLTQMDDHFGRLTEATDSGRVARLRAAWTAYVQGTSGFEAFADRREYLPAIALLKRGAGGEAFTTLTRELTDFNASLGESAAATAADAAATVDSSRTITIVLLVVAALLGVAIAVLTSRTIVGGVRQLVRAAHGIAQGDVEQRVEIATRDELGEAGDAFGEMIAYLDEMAAAARRIAAGDLATDVHPKSDRDVLGNAFAQLSAQLRAALGDRSALEALVARLEQLSDHDLTTLERGLAAVAAGDLTVQGRISAQPIVAAEGAAAGRLAEIFNRMLDQLESSVGEYDAMRARVSEMLRRISAETQSVASASQQMASTSEETGRAIGEIASAVTEVAAGAERQGRTMDEARELTEGVVAASRGSAANAQETARAAEQARAVAADGAEAIARATEGMKTLESVSRTVRAAMVDLGAKSDRIGGIVATITGIAEQTNLLALNAAIEAARAGEQGRGFAVVAEEVRKLAEESQQAAASISGLVEEIQRGTGTAVEGQRSGSEQIETQAASVEQARAAFERIGASVEDMTTRIGAIADAVGEVTASAAQMEANMAEVVSVAEQSSASSEQVSASTQQTSASSQQVAASAQELARSADELARLVGEFRLVAA